MSELTKEYLDKALANQTRHFDEKIEKEVGELAGMVAKGFADIQQRLDVNDRVERLE